jgi:uncharacterized integral membrane protein (TIGR00698 family)
MVRRIGSALLNPIQEDGPGPGPDVGPRRSVRGRLDSISEVAAPLVASLGVAVCAWLIGSRIAFLGPTAAALLIGTALRSTLPISAGLTSRTEILGPRVLQVSIVLLGTSVGVAEVLTVALSSLPVMLVTVFGGLTAIMFIGRRLGVDATIGSLLAVGTSICGASAIAAAAPVLGASVAQVSYAVSIVFMFNFAAVLGFPVVAHLLGMSAGGFAIWAGTSINDTSSVLAAAAGFGPAVSAQAATVKLARTMMILPTTLVLALMMRRRGGGDNLPISIRRAVPWFAVAFLVGSAVNSAGLIPGPVGSLMGQLATLGSVLALSAIGLSTDLRRLRRVGARPIALAGVGWLAIATTSLILQAVVH